MRTVAHLKIAQKATIVGFSDSDLTVKFLEMGCIPGTEIELVHKAPFGSPVCVSVCGYELALRTEEAEKILIT